ncbi:MAG: hypothetical protein HYY30_05160 [Chloroflexi bacterium]|nr:hypothetical protein [Chloroflexota bacterium]
MMERRILKPLAIIAVLGLALGLAIGCTQASTVATPQEFYRGKTINWIVSSVPGADTDLLARALAIHLSKETGATVKVENMNTDEGLNYVYAEAKRDGLTMVINSTVAIIANDIQKAPGVLYETEKYNFVADVNPSGTVMQLSVKSPHKTLEALRQAKGLKGGGTSAKGALVTGAAVMTEILGLDAKVITGYKGKRELTLALGRGEVDFMVTSDSMAQKDADDGFIVNLFSVTDKRSAVVPDLPTIFELGVKIPKELDAAHKFITGSGTSTLLPPEVPQDRVDYLRNVFLKMSDSKDVQNDVAKISPVWTPFVSGKEMQERMIAIKGNKDLADQLDAIFAKYKATQ